MKGLIICLAVLASASCSKKKEETKYGNIKAQFANNTDTTSLATSAPSEFKVKLKYILVAEDKVGTSGAPSAENNYNGNNVGKGIRVWINPSCTSTVVSGNGSSYSDIKTDDECAANGMEYFDFNRTSDEVNTDLNSQGISAEVGTYRYVTMAFLGEQAGGMNTLPNIKWAHADSGVTTQEYADFEVEFSAKFDTPLTVNEGQTVIFKLNYDLSSMITTGLAGAGSEKVLGSGTTQPGTYDDCDTDKNVCVTMPTYTLTIEAE